MTLPVQDDGTGVSFAVRVLPRAQKNAFQGVREGALVVRLAAPPLEGRANAALQAFLAEALGVRRAQVAIRTGEKSRNKVVRVQGIPADRVLRLVEDP